MASACLVYTALFKRGLLHWARFDVNYADLYTVAMTIKAVVHRAEEGGFWAEVPALPGCVTQAEPLDELRTNLKEAIELWLDG
jgi:hypothetical protein